MKAVNAFKLFKVVWYRWLTPQNRYCCVCGQTSGGFLPYRGGSRSMPNAMRALKTVGSDLDEFECPCCGAHDRERHLLLYLRASGVWDEFRSADILHFAPEKRLAKLVGSQQPRLYVKADLHPGGDDIHCMDLHSIAVKAESFDIVIANHVLEHVDDDRLAMREISRVLRPGGCAIVQTPYSRVLQHTFSDPGIKFTDARREIYGQEDHVRLFGRDIFTRLVAAGALENRVKTHQDLLADVDSHRYGVNPDEPFFLFRKPL
ncbi:class I SAM-dependent methyltransferase [Oleiagrimonas sp. MCCC 1A03011]|uniref:class I SAM-dependent methyltransferase n=1 Tax=Oleiagrimonas sp. MCCC 1A03011 TaxID=1926883 RepID=UPI000DC367EF|nr:class I SAM-dependent methyltransferase [Oleiagrimonas sp. MCCC 1A03011]RAP59387.1 SAM-dependent methyltransferase [Oleiagrimonas sp. MCCC 1A03011]